MVAMASQARAATGTAEITIVADCRYYGGLELLTCAKTGINAYVHKPLTSIGVKRSSSPNSASSSMPRAISISVRPRSRDA